MNRIVITGTALDRPITLDHAEHDPAPNKPQHGYAVLLTAEQTRTLLDTWTHTPPTTNTPQTARSYQHNDDGTITAISDNAHTSWHPTTHTAGAPRYSTADSPIPITIHRVL
ncbi:hypothetical protein [Subtercola sp. RTI3]|uniref:hypothetical protein n=1 Tax=Subtercola sp. RTI3 TaxID=3048639 RepID=UPI002B2348A5|nr:hypothetical protein [Subtercola sp. RTI3]MEA9986797.1 hypothetical protein [Subtercola sp. RTI3]